MASLKILNNVLVHAEKNTSTDETFSKILFEASISDWVENENASYMTTTMTTSYCLKELSVHCPQRSWVNLIDKLR